MSDALAIDFRWLCRAQSSPFDRAFSAEIGLRLGNSWLTELEELESRTTRTHLRACTHTLALWLAGNWWRLRWEPESRCSRDDVDWRIAHSIGSAGGGFAWPNILFASDGPSLAVASIPRLRPAAFEPLRYLNGVSGRITAVEFEYKVDGFVEAVISRLHDLEIDDQTLPQLWNEVLQERRDPETARWRKLVALCGYDPDEAPPRMIEMLIEDNAGLGAGALEEVAVHGRHDTPAVLGQLVELAGSADAPAPGGVRGILPLLRGRVDYGTDSRPWQRATRLARFAREEWGLGQRPVSNMELGGLIEVNASVFKEGTKSPVPMPAALRTEHPGAYNIYMNSLWATSRRFAVSRLLGDYLYQQDEGRLIPATDGKTARQQFQRAFAQEFLCPFGSLREMIGSDQPKEDQFEEAAAFFDVSPWVVQSTLVNKGELDREALLWASEKALMPV